MEAIIALAIALAGLVSWFFTKKKYPFDMYTETTTEALPEAPELPVAETSPTHQEQLYQHAKSLLGKNLTLDDSIPWMVGCAQAVSYVLATLPIPGIPKKGISGTALLLKYLRESKHFEQVDTYEPGNIIINPTGFGNGKIRGHVGICGIYQIMSNNSETGLWDTQWTIARWTDYYEKYGGITTLYFKPL